MKKHLWEIVCVVAVVAAAAYGVYATQQKGMSLSDLTLADVEVLARYELPEVVIECDSGESGRCFEMGYEEGLYGVCRFFCYYTGYTGDYCSSLYVDFVNLCSAMGIH